MTGADGTHFNRPTFVAWLPDSTMFVADGYNGTRVAKFDKNASADWQPLQVDGLDGKVSMCPHAAKHSTQQAISNDFQPRKL